MKITPAPAVPTCRRCLLPAINPHPNIEACLLMHQAVLARIGNQYDELLKKKQRDDKGARLLVQVIWKLAIGRSTIEFTKAEMEAIPQGANIKVTNKADGGGVVLTAIVTPPAPAAPPAPGKETLQ